MSEIDPSELQEELSGANVREQLAFTRVFDRLVGGGPTETSLDSRYTILSELGIGGMGAVLLAHDKQLGREVAIKFIRLGRASRGVAQAETRLLREARALARFSHPNVVQVFDVCAEASAAFFVMEYIRGSTLREYADEQPDAFASILRLLIQAGRGLAAAHRLELVHRDVKPNNIMVGEDGNARVVDFGLVRWRELLPTVPDGPSTPSVTEEPMSDGLILGTPGYVAPELADGATATTASDQFAFCITARACLWHLRPLAQAQLFAAQAAGRLVLRGPSKGGRHRRIWKVLSRGLSLDPEDRWPSVDALLDALEAAPSRAKARIIVPLGTIALLGVAFVAGRSTPCDDRIWERAEADAVRSAFSGVGKAYADRVAGRVIEQLDAYAARWSAASAQSCADRNATGRTAHTDLVAVCLRRLRADFDGVTRAIIAGGEGFAVDAPHWVEQLEAVHRCDPQGIQAVRSLDPHVAALLRSAALSERKGDLDEAHATATAALESATANADQNATIHAQLTLGRLSVIQGDEPRGLELLEPAFWGARAAGFDSAAVEAATAIATTPLTREQGADHVRSWIRHGEAIASRGETRLLARVSLYRASASLDDDEGNFQAALESLGKGLALLDEDAGLPLEHVRMRNLLALVERELGDLRQADSLLEGAYRDAAVLVGDGHPFLADLLNNRASVLLDLDQVDAAADLYKQALDLRLAAFVADHPIIAGSYNNMGQVAFARSDYDEAADWFSRALAIYESDVDAGDVYNNLANTHFMRGDSGKAIDLHRRALDARMAVHGNQHPEVADSLGNLGAILNTAERFDEAAEVLQQALELMQRIYGPTHTNIARTLYNLAEAHVGLGAMVEARPLVQRSLEIRIELGDQLGIAASQWLLARSVADEDPRLARELAAEAREGLVAVDAPEDVANLDRWVAQLPE